MVDNLIELTALDLEISRDGKTASYPVLSADLAYSVGSFPVVSVTVSTAGAFSDEGSDRSSASDILRDDPEGALGELTISMAPAGEEPADYVLFCGYVATVTPTFQSSVFSVSATLTGQLIAGTAAINGMPGGSLVYFNLGGGSNGTQKPISYDALMKQLGLDMVKGETLSGELGNLFQQSPARCVAYLLDRLRGAVSGSTEGMKISDTLIFGEGPLKVKIPQPTPIPGQFLDQMSKALKGAPAASVFNAVLRQLYLTMVPETMGTSGEPCKMVVQPTNAWDVESHFDLSISDILGLQEHTAYRLDQRVDFWCVNFPPSKDALYSKFAVYGPGVTDGHGKAWCYTEAEWNAKLTEIGKDKLLKTYSAKMLFLPGWLSVLAKTSATKDANLSKNLPVRIPLLGDAKTNETSLIDVAERVAVTGYLQEGCAVVAAGMSIPFSTYLSLLPHLGKMGTFMVPDAYTAQKKDITEIPTSIRYGLLSSLSMRITVERKELHVSCGVRFTHVHTEDIHKEFCAEHPLYGLPIATPQNVAENFTQSAQNILANTVSTRSDNLAASGARA